MIPTGKTLAEMEVELSRMIRALDELTESVAIMRNEVQHADGMESQPDWPSYQSDKLRACLSAWSIWVPALRALDIELHESTKEIHQ